MLTQLWICEDQSWYEHVPCSVKSAGYSSCILSWGFKKFALKNILPLLYSMVSY
jgi:hypothetical protein